MATCNVSNLHLVEIGSLHWLVGHLCDVITMDVYLFHAFILFKAEGERAALLLVRMTLGT